MLTSDHSKHLKALQTPSILLYVNTNTVHVTLLVKRHVFLIIRLGWPHGSVTRGQPQRQPCRFFRSYETDPHIEILEPQRHYYSSAQLLWDLAALSLCSRMLTFEWKVYQWYSQLWIKWGQRCRTLEIFITWRGLFGASDILEVTQSCYSNVLINSTVWGKWKNKIIKHTDVKPDLALNTRCNFILRLKITCMSFYHWKHPIGSPPCVKFLIGSFTNIDKLFKDQILPTLKC